jgi:hypothetical protein
MNRKEGYYWVKQYKETDYEVALYEAGMWWLCAIDCSYCDGELHAINETQILPPNN